MCASHGFHFQLASPLTSTGDYTAGMSEDSECWRVWHQAAIIEPVHGAIAAIYADLDREIAARSPTCWISGRCCHFEAFGHRLYVTGLEIAWFLAKLDVAGGGAAGVSSAAPSQRSNAESPLLNWQTRLQPAGLCPFQVSKLCGVHAVRPLGCRIFFCQEGTDVWQHELYEQFLSRLRRLHDEQGLPYQYMEWRMGLAEAARALPEKCARTSRPSG